MILSFQLTMPNVGSWNGKWSAESDPHFRCIKISREKAEKLAYKANESANFNPRNHQSLVGGIDYYYNFGDGWSANVEVKQITSSEKKKLLKKTKGFSGYDWMIQSILKHYKIQPS